ncbi:insulinase family protein, partial [Anoxybacillus flavithermus]|uniref:insulinase family protein n=1 Tax=Anoxybacillus flavithermus TaxID=33934 RepID=UPI001865CB0A
VYLDAVFEPNFRRNPQILAQEGWHYHLENGEDDLIYKGVVYNEMKGATASPEDQIYFNITKNLYADSIYQYESGGLPSAIPSLTQDAFVDFFQRYYHPSNSFTVVYGDIEIESIFEQLEEYFEGKGAFAETVELSFEKQLPEKHDYECTYSITEGDDPTDKDYLALAWHVSNAGDLLDNNGLEVLEEILFGNQQSPLKKALLEAEIGGDINGGVDHPGYPNMFVITAKYSSADKMSRFKEVVRETLTQLVEEGVKSES